MFKCKVCAEKDRHIAYLVAENAQLRKVALPNAFAFETPFAQREADRILSASDEPIEVTESEELRQIASLLTGSYDNSQVDVE